MKAAFNSEADMVAEWLTQLSANRRDNPWTPYPETCGWDVLLAHRDGYQLGIEAKLSLNAKVLDQALADQHSLWRQDGPDYRAVLVPAGSGQHHLGRIADAIGIRVLEAYPAERGTWRHIDLPDEDTSYRAWPNWCPAARCKLPDYVPDVTGGSSAPVALTPWKVKAIKLMVLLEHRGFVTRADMKALQISPTRWTDHFTGFLSPGPNGGYVRNHRTPNFRAQHPVNFPQIEADFAEWSQGLPDCQRLAA